jgi:membrane peptidoglycan carboxypeptidase
MASIRFYQWMTWSMGLAIIAGAGTLLWQEGKTSRFQAELLHRLNDDLNFQVEPGSNDAIRFPKSGPYDERLGYTRLPDFMERLSATHRIELQARPSDALRRYMEMGGFPPYEEKSTAGLLIRDRKGETMLSASYPQRTYTSFAEIPPLIVKSLLFIENRELLDPLQPYRNPAIEWDRFALALASLPLKLIDSDNQRAGGSTLATQIEKYRHSQEGRTTSGVEKLRQMLSASVRAYRDSTNTVRIRHRIVVDYLNSTPLSAQPGIGETNGIGDGLWAWYGTDFAKANQILRSEPRTEEELMVQAVAYKQALSLILAQRRPSAYLARNRNALNELTNTHLDLLRKEEVIPAALADAARSFPLRLRDQAPQTPEPSFIEQKAANAIRARLMTTLGLTSLYDLDRLDLEVDSTLDQQVQTRVTTLLESLSDLKGAQAAGLVGDRLLNQADPSRILYSVTLFERTAEANLTRVQVDTLPQPLDLNEGAKLDLGSTAKLRTLVTYLEIIANLHDRYKGRASYELEAALLDAPDRLSQWVLRTMADQQGLSMAELLQQAMLRVYSANPEERFFTGGGLHSFGNFDEKDDERSMTVAEAFRHSVNLVFVRLMRDVVNHFIAEGTDNKDDLMSDARHPARRTYLAQFADQEGSAYLNKFWSDYKNLSADAALERLAGKIKATPERLTSAFRAVRPHASEADLAAFLERRMPAGGPPLAQIRALYERYDPQAWSLNDRGYIAGVHPLELWLVSYLQEAPVRQRGDMLRQGRDPRLESYAWLFAARSKQAQDTRIGIALEEQAFEKIHAAWKRLGYPFDTLIPSYATAIGSSADRPGALAELMGIILNDGVRLPTLRIARLHFAKASPYETLMKPAKLLEGAEQAMRPEVARTVRLHLLDIVEQGTARRVKGVFALPDGSTLPIGGKTGTGDHRFERYGPGGVVLESRVVNRTATFVFYVGDRFFGVITAHVHGPEAAEYRFTSALPAQLLKALGPALSPLFAPDAQTAERGG